jgi:putative transcriptional regulator
MTEQEKNFGDLLIEGMQEAVAFKRGELKALVRVRTTARGARVDEPPIYDAARVRLVRERLRVSQPVFAAALGVSARTVAAWERGARVPDGAARRLLQVAEERPEALLTKIHPADASAPHS